MAHDVSHSFRRWILRSYMVAILIPIAGTSATIAACSTIPDQIEFHEGQLISISSHRVVSYDTLRRELLAADVIYVGEEHYTPSHIQAAIHVLTTLIESGTRPALALEMFSWDSQEALDRWIRGEIPTEEQFLAAAHWNANWGGDYRAYKPLIEFARRHRIPVYALNPPRSLVRLVAKQGLDRALQDPAMAQWEIDFIPRDDPDYRHIIFEQLRACHPNLPHNAYERLYEASIFRDEGMAHVIKAYLRRRTHDEGPLVSYTGSGHIQYGVPVPARVKRDLPVSINDLTLYLMSFDPTRQSDIQEIIEKRIADYLWLTTPGPRGIQQRCG